MPVPFPFLFPSLPRFPSLLQPSLTFPPLPQFSVPLAFKSRDRGSREALYKIPRVPSEKKTTASCKSCRRPKYTRWTTICKVGGNALPWGGCAHGRRPPRGDSHHRCSSPVLRPRSSPAALCRVPRRSPGSVLQSVSGESVDRMRPTPLNSGATSIRRGSGVYK